MSASISTPASEVSRPPSKVRRTPLPATGGEPDRTKALSTTTVAGTLALPVTSRLGIELALTRVSTADRRDGVDVGAWLRGLGLERYERAFRDNDIDVEVLPELTADDLIGLGVASIGHRRKLLAAVAALRPAAPLPETQPVRAEPAPPAFVPRPPEAERRQLTVMFVDLVGSTALSTRLDPEDMREVIRAYQGAVAGEVARFGGHIAKFMGDGVLAYFGFPQAHEEDAERAIRAGLDILGTVGRLRSPAGEPLAARIGIATGLVVVGDLVGTGAAQEQAVVGETPNLAARLQALAEPDSIVVAAATRRLVGGLFECLDLGPVEAKGFAEPVRAYRVLGPGAVASRVEALHTAPAPLVGREEELELFLRRWGQAKGGEGRVVLLSGERRGSASRVCWRRCRNGSATSRTCACAISARHTARTAHCTRSSPSSSARPASRAAIRRRCGSRSWRHCSRRSRRPRKTSRSWPSCCRCRPTIATPRRPSRRSARESGPSRCSCTVSRAWPRSSRVVGSIQCVSSTTISTGRRRASPRS